MPGGSLITRLLCILSEIFLVYTNIYVPIFFYFLIKDIGNIIKILI